MSPEFRDGLIALIPNLRAFARSLVGDRDRADDLVQETLLKAWHKADTFQEGTNQRAWLFVILRNQYYSQGRRRGREVEDPEGDLVGSLTERAGQEGSVALSELRRAMRGLPDEQREAIVLVGAGGFSYEEAAEVVGCAVGTMKSRVSRARDALSRAVSEPVETSSARPPKTTASRSSGRDIPHRTARRPAVHDERYGQEPQQASTA
jgi:RNA polymerase sigma-70 factor (ECF subfamily)